jgi:hypothetical protein
MEVHPALLQLVAPVGLAVLRKHSPVRSSLPAVLVATLLLDTVAAEEEAAGVVAEAVAPMARPKMLVAVAVALGMMPAPTS